MPDAALRVGPLDEQSWHMLNPGQDVAAGGNAMEEGSVSLDIECEGNTTGYFLAPKVTIHGAVASGWWYDENNNPLVLSFDCVGTDLRYSVMPGTSEFGASEDGLPWLSFRVSVSAKGYACDFGEGTAEEPLPSGEGQFALRSSEASYGHMAGRGDGFTMEDPVVGMTIAAQRAQGTTVTGSASWELNLAP